MKNKKKLAVTSLVLALVSLIPLIVVPNNMTGIIIFVVIAIILGIAAIILGFISKSTAKRLSMAGIIIGFISIMIMFFSLVGFAFFSKAKNCVVINEQTARCEMEGRKVEIPRIILKDEQYAKEN